MSKLDDKDLSKIAAGGSLKGVAPDDPGGNPPGDTKDITGGGGGGSIPIEDEPPADGSTQGLEQD